MDSDTERHRPSSAVPQPYHTHPHIPLITYFNTILTTTSADNLITPTPEKRRNLEKYVKSPSMPAWCDYYKMFCPSYRTIKC